MYGVAVLWRHASGSGVPREPLDALALTTALYNVVPWLLCRRWRRQAPRPLAPRACSNVFLALDVVVLVAAVHFTGGALSPFRSFLALTVLAAGVPLSRRLDAVAHGLWAIGLFSALVWLEWAGVVPHVSTPFELPGVERSLTAIASSEIALGGLLAGVAIVSLFLGAHLERAYRLGREVARTRNERALLEQDLQRRDEFTALVAHELRQPLGPLKVGLHLAAQGSQSTELIQRMQRQTDRLERLIDHLLRGARMEATDFPIRPVEVPVGGLLGNVLSLVHDRLASRDVRLSCPETLAVWADPERIEQVLLNLVDNALKYSPPGEPIEIDAVARDGACEITVRDHGPGVPPEAEGLLFRRYFRTGDALELRVPGSGLGLYLSRRIAEAHGGGLELRRPSEGGSAFTLTLPVAKQPSRGRRASSTPYPRA